MDSLEESCEVQEDRRGHLRGPGKVTWLLHKQEEDYRASERGWDQVHRPTLARVTWILWSKLEIEGKGHYPGQCSLLGAICSK